MTITQIFVNGECRACGQFAIWMPMFDREMWTLKACSPECVATIKNWKFELGCYVSFVDTSYRRFYGHVTQILSEDSVGVTIELPPLKPGEDRGAMVCCGINILRFEPLPDELGE